MSSTDDAVAFVHNVNKDRALQVRVGAFRPRDWASFFAIAAELGYDVDLNAFFQGRLSDKVVRFCPALVRFAGQLYSYKIKSGQPEKEELPTGRGARTAAGRSWRRSAVPP